MSDWLTLAEAVALVVLAAVIIIAGALEKCFTGG